MSFCSKIAPLVCLIGVWNYLIDIWNYVIDIWMQCSGKRKIVFNEHRLKLWNGNWNQNDKEIYILWEIYCDRNNAKWNILVTNRPQNLNQIKRRRLFAKDAKQISHPCDLVSWYVWRTFFSKTVSSHPWNVHFTKIPPGRCNLITI